MKVKLLVSRCGIDFSQAAGDVIEVSAAEGKRMIAAKQAVAVGRVEAEKGHAPAAPSGDADTVAGGSGGADTVAGGADTVAGGNG